MALISTILVDGVNVNKANLRTYLEDREDLFLPVGGDMEMQTGAVLKLQPTVNTVGLGFVGDGTETGLNYIHEHAFGLMCDGVQIMTLSNWGCFFAETNSRVIIGGPDTQVGTNISKFETIASGNAGTSGEVHSAFMTGGSSAAAITFQRSKSSTIGAHTTLAANDVVWSIAGKGSDGTAFRSSTQIVGEVDSTVATSIVPGRILFQTANSAGALTEAMRIDSAQEVAFPNIGTTASAANAVLNAGYSPANQLLRSTSTKTRKANFDVLSDSEVDGAFDALKPTLFTSQHWADDPRDVFLGFLAEDCYAADARLATRGTDGEIEGVNDRAILALTVAKLQRIGQRVAALEGQ